MIALIKRNINFVSIFFATVLLVYYHWNNQIPPNTGDGISHYFIANAVWSNPLFLLNHWGKPLFVVLVAPFAYFGFFSYIIFNILVFAISAYLGQKILAKLKVGLWAQCLFPYILITVSDYTTNVLGGLTEPFFGLLLLLSCFLFLKKKWMFFALVVSFMPFARSEGQLIVVAAFLLLIFLKKWKYIPFLAGGFLLYAIIGYFVLDDFFWYFNNNPYTGAANIYGHGKWSHYVLNWKGHIGQGVLTLMFGCIIALVVKMISKRQNQQPKETTFLVLFIAFCYFGIIFVHAYLWTYGLKGAYGLSRLATHGLPAIIIVYLYFIHQCIIHWNKSVRILLFLAYSILLVVLIRKLPFPNQPNSFDLQIIKSAQYIKTYKKTIGKIYYYNPLFAISYGVNQKINDQNSEQKIFGNLSEELEKMTPGDVIVWDTHFGPQEMGLPQQKIDKNSQHLSVVKSFVSTNRNTSPLDASQFSKTVIYKYVHK